jgi:CcmD family protein
MDQRNFTYMFYGFAAAWLILALYVVSLLSRGRKLQEQLETLKRTLSQEKL